VIVQLLLANHVGDAGALGSEFEMI
jgi:hypothetical protein